MQLDQFSSLLKVNHYRMRVRCGAGLVEFCIVLPDDTVESIFNEFHALFPNEDQESFMVILKEYFPVRHGKFTVYRETK